MSPLTPGRSLAVDPSYHALGTPMYVSAPTMTHVPKAAPFNRLMIGQDVGSAIKGPERGDIYFGSGDAAGQIAGVTKHPGRFFVLVPKDAAAKTGAAPDKPRRRSRSNEPRRRQIAGRPGRTVTPDEAELWSRVARSVDKVRSKPRVPSHVDAVEPTPAAPRGLLRRRLSPSLDARGSRPRRTPAPKAVRPPPLAEFDRRAVRQVASGKVEIDARLDLHGMRQRDARIELRAFLRAAQARGLKTVLVITGKGDAPWSAIISPARWENRSAASCATACRNGWASPSCAPSCSATRVPACATAAMARSTCSCARPGRTQSGARCDAHSHWRSLFR